MPEHTPGPLEVREVAGESYGCNVCGADHEIEVIYGRCSNMTTAVVLCWNCAKDLQQTLGFRLDLLADKKKRETIV